MEDNRKSEGVTDKVDCSPEGASMSDCMTGAGAGTLGLFAGGCAISDDASSWRSDLRLSIMSDRLPEELELLSAGGFAITDTVDESSESQGEGPVALLDDTSSIFRSATGNEGEVLPSGEALSSESEQPGETTCSEKITDTNIIQSRVSKTCNRVIDCNQESAAVNRNKGCVMTNCREASERGWRPQQCQRLASFVGGSTMEDNRKSEGVTDKVDCSPEGASMSDCMTGAGAGTLGLFAGGCAISDDASSWRSDLRLSIMSDRLPEELELLSAGGFAITDTVDESSESQGEGPVALLDDTSSIFRSATGNEGEVLPSGEALSSESEQPGETTCSEKITDTNIIQSRVSKTCNRVIDCNQESAAVNRNKGCVMTNCREASERGWRPQQQRLASFVGGSTMADKSEGVTDKVDCSPEGASTSN